MAVLGGILLLVAVAIAAFALWAASNSAAPAASVEVFGNYLTMSSTTMFVLGAVSVLLLLLGVWLAFFATKRRYRSHRERRMLEKREKEQASELNETRRRLGEPEQGAAGRTSTRQSEVVAAPERTVSTDPLDSRHRDDLDAPRRDERL